MLEGEQVEPAQNLFYTPEEKSPDPVEPESDNLESEEESDDEIIEELTDAEDEETTEDEDDNEPVELFGRQITRDEFETMESQQMMRVDYSKKTELVAEERKGIATLGDSLKAAISSVESLLLEEESSEEMEELKKDDYGEYMRRVHDIEAKRAKVKEAAAVNDTVSDEAMTRENQKLIEAMPAWSDPKKGQSSRKKDIDGALSYAGEIGYTNADLTKLSDHKTMRALIDAGKYRALKAGNASSTKRKTKASKKVTGKKSGVKKTAEQLWYGD